MSEMVVDDTAQLGDIAGVLNVTNARLVATTARLLATGDWNQAGQRTPAGFLALTAGLSPERAKLVVRVAERRHQFPHLIELFEHGQLSLEQIAEAVEAPAWADAKIAHFATISTVTKIRRAMRSNMFEGDPDDPPPPVPVVRDRLSFGVARNGRWRINGEFGIDDGRRIQAALTETKDALFSNGHTDVTWPEAFTECFDRSLDTITSPSRRDHYRTWIHLDVSSGDLLTTDGWRIPQPIRDHLLCDGVIQPVWERDGVPFSVGRTQRIVPDRTRRIIEHRDRGCRVPGCNSSFVEVHHIEHWEHGGTTDTANLISFCRLHHRMHHQGRLDITGNADLFDSIEFTDHDGTHLKPGATPTIPTGPPPKPPNPYRPPLAGRFDWRWIGLGWIHPNGASDLSVG